MSVMPIAAAAAAAAAVSQANRSRKFQKPIKIHRRRLCFPGESVPWSSKKQNPNGMMNSYGVCASKREEGFQANFQEEALEEDNPSLGIGGLEATLNGLSKWLILVAPAAIVLWRHDALALWSVTGAVLNTILSVALKRILNQERPISALKPDPGMPSSHAQCFFYIISFLNLSLVEWYGLSTLTTILCGIIFVLGSFLSWLRVSQQLHTLSQVTVGAVIGSVFAILWSWLWYSLVSDSFISLSWVRIAVTLSAVGSYLSLVRYFILASTEEERYSSYRVDKCKDL